MDTAQTAPGMNHMDNAKVSEGTECTKNADGKNSADSARRQINLEFQDGGINRNGNRIFPIHAVRSVSELLVIL